MVVIAGLLAVLAVVLVVYGFASGLWLGGLFYAALLGWVLVEWATSRRASDDSRRTADRMLFAVFFLATGLARPALDYLEALLRGLV